MYTSSRRYSTDSQQGETDKDRKMRLVGDRNRRAGRQLTKQLHDIDKHLQVNLKQINSDIETNTNSTSPTLSSPSPKYLASSSDSLETSSQSSQRSVKLTYRAVDQNLPTPGDERTVGRKLKSHSSQQQSQADGGDADGKLLQPREKTFTIIDHGSSSVDADSVTDNYHGPESQSRSRTLDALDNRRLVQGGSNRPRKANIRNEMVNIASSKSKTVRSGASSRLQDAAPMKAVKSDDRTLDSSIQKIPLQKMDQRGLLSGKIVPTKAGEKLEYRQQAFNLNDSNSSAQIRHGVFRSRHVSVNNNGQLQARDELDRRQLRKMHILSNLNKKHMNRDASSEDIDTFVNHEYQVGSRRNFGRIPASPANGSSSDIGVDMEKPRPKSAMFSSQRRPRFTSEDDDSVFLDDLDIIDIDDDGLSSDDEDGLSSSFVAPLNPSSRHPLGLHTRSTSDISPATFHRGDNSHFRGPKSQVRASEKNVVRMDEMSRDPSNSNLTNIRAVPETELSLTNKKPLVEIGTDKDKTVSMPQDSVQSDNTSVNSIGSISPKSDPNSSLKSKTKETFDKTAGSKAVSDSGRSLPPFPRKLKPLFKPEGDETEVPDTGSPTSPKSDSGVIQMPLQRASSHVYGNKKLSRSRQKTWTAGVGSSGARDILKRPLPPTSFGNKPRVKSDFSDKQTRSITRRRARTSSELKKCSTVELDTLKTGDMPSAESGSCSNAEKDKQPVEMADGLRNCRYLRTKTDTDRISPVNVETC